MPNETNQKLSKRLNEVFDHIDMAHPSYTKIKNNIESEYLDIQLKLNPECDADIKRELDYHFDNFIQNTLKKLMNR